MQLPQDWRNRDSWRGKKEKNKKNHVCVRTQDKGAVTAQEPEPDLPVSVWESLANAWVDSGLPLDQRAPIAAVLGGVAC